jgi:predicted TIM-barrel fold metal-dependent hydrolase
MALTPANRDFTLVDTHAHIFRADLPMAPGGLHLPTHDFETAEYLAILDAYGVENAVIAAPSFLGTYNDYMIKALKREPRLRGTVIVDPGIDPYILKAMDGDGVVGVRLSFRGRKQLPDLAGTEFQRLLWRLADLDWHVHLHIEGQRLPEVLPILTRSPVKLVVDHFGRPDPETGAESEGFQAYLRAFDSGRTWGKLSGGFRIVCDPQPLAERLLAVAGPERLVWGSDCPFTDFEKTVTYQSTIDSLVRWVPSRDDRNTIAQTSLKLYRFS